VNLEEMVRTLPDEPGVYQYFDENGRLLYVGKASSLRKRVRSYWRFTPRFRPSPDSGVRIFRMLEETKSLEYIVVGSEADALILENSLIKQLHPKYNILLRDDKTYPYIYVDEGAEYPRFELTRKVVGGKKISYYGPFPSGARALLDTIYENYPLVQKRGSVSGKRACLFHQIGRCPAPCEGKMERDEYMRVVEEVKRALVDRRLLIEKLSCRMEELAVSMRYEEAAVIRDRIKSIESLEIHSDIDLAREADYDIFAISHGLERGALFRLFVRSGRVVSSSYDFFSDVENYDPREAYRQALVSHYKAEMPYRSKIEIITAHPLEEADSIAEAISLRVGKRVTISSPVRGAKARLKELALKNAGELLGREEAPWSRRARAIAELFGLSRFPVRIEIFDNSHMMGEAVVGAMVVYDNGEWKREAYRHYNLHARDEYSQMREMLERRIVDFSKEPPPDLWLIDGGDTLLKLADRLLHEAGVNMDTLAISKEKMGKKSRRAKGGAGDTVYFSDGRLRLPTHDERLQMLQMLRDEAHRFAISFHRKKKRREDIEVSLLRKRGIGPATLKRLLDYFGSFEAIERAGYEELKGVVGVKIADILTQETENGER